MMSIPSKQTPHELAQIINKKLSEAGEHYKFGLGEKGIEFGTPIPPDHPEITHVEMVRKRLRERQQLLLDIYLPPEATEDKWQCLEVRCEAAEAIIINLALLKDMQAIVEVVKDLWRRAQHAGSVRNLPPEMPPISDDIQAIQAAGLLLKWVNSQRPAGERPASVTGGSASIAPSSPTIAVLPNGHVVSHPVSVATDPTERTDTGGSARPAPHPGPAGENPALATGEGLPQYVTLDQMAALVSRSKKTLERLKKRMSNPLPNAKVDGGGGKPDEWIWSEIRPWLEAEFSRKLPKLFPKR
jgi:hypothetical protein